ncbi:MAG: hypothetical protein AABY32_00225 [Nanoarchaeota archaeon]
MKFSKLINRILNNNVYNKRIAHFFEEIIDDIKLLNDDEMYSNNMNPTVKKNYNNTDFIITTKKLTSKKYKEKYCPTSLFDYFNQSEKINYMMLRVKIDKLLGIKNTSYQF